MAAEDRSTIEQLLPARSTPEVETEVRTVSIDDDDAATVFDVLASETSRAVLTNLYEEPGTASDLADRVDTSHQNVHYHLTKLTDAGLIQQVDTWYSSRGVEMTVYGPSNDPLVLLASDDDRDRATRDIVDRTFEPADSPPAVTQ